MADVVTARAGEGDIVLVQDYHFSLLGRMLAEERPDLRTVHFLHTPFAEPAHARGAARRRGGRAARRHGRLRRLRVPLPQVGGGVQVVLRRGRPRRAPDVRGAARPRRRRARGGGGVGRVRGGGRRAARRGGRAPHHRPDRPHGAVEEHRAGDARLRGAADHPPRVARARSCTSRSPTRAGRGWRSISPTAPMSSTRPNASTTRSAPRRARTVGRPSCCRSRTTGPARWPP